MTWVMETFGVETGSLALGFNMVQQECFHQTTAQIQTTLKWGMIINFVYSQWYDMPLVDNDDGGGAGGDDDGDGDDGDDGDAP